MRKMYLVPADQLHKQTDSTPCEEAKPVANRHVPSPKPPAKKEKHPPKRPKPRSRSQHPYEKWVKVRKQIRDDEIGREARVKAVADFLKSVLPPHPPVVHTVQKQTTHTQMEARVAAAAAIPSTSSAVEIYETPKRRPDDDDDDEVDVADGGFVEEAQRYGKKQFRAVASPYLTPYLYKRSFLDTQYGIWKDGDTFMIGDSQLTVDSDSDITIKGKHFRGTHCLWELLTRRKVQRDVMTDDLKAYKKILPLTNGHLTGYELDGNIHIS